MMALPSIITHVKLAVLKTIASLTLPAGGSQMHALDVPASAPDLLRTSVALTSVGSTAATWLQASPILR